MSALFWVSTYTVVLVPLFLVARPLLGGKVRQTTPLIIVVLFIPLLVVGISTTLGKMDADLKTNISGVPAAKIFGRIHLAPNAQEHVMPGDIVIVFAQGVGDPAMPAATLQKSAADLPFEFVLSDDHALMHGAGLSDYEEVVISARISRTGNPADAVKGLQVQGVRTLVKKSTFIELRIASMVSTDNSVVARR